MNHIDDLHKAFITGEPYEHVVIPDFFSPEIASKIVEEFPDPLNQAFDWWGNQIAWLACDSFGFRSNTLYLLQEAL